MDAWDRLDEWLGKLEQFLLAIFLSLMILVAFWQIVLRNLLATGMPWGDTLVRYLVLWVGFIGAALAAREGKHIKIDVALQWIPGVGSVLIRFMTNLFSAFICGVLTVAAYKFIQNEALMGDISALGCPVWFLQLIIPITFALMTLRFGFNSFRELSTIFKNS